MVLQRAQQDKGAFSGSFGILKFPDPDSASTSDDVGRAIGARFSHFGWRTCAERRVYRKERRFVIRPDPTPWLVDRCEGPQRRRMSTHAARVSCKFADHRRRRPDAAKVDCPRDLASIRPVRPGMPMEPLPRSCGSRVLRCFGFFGGPSSGVRGLGLRARLPPLGPTLQRCRQRLCWQHAVKEPAPCRGLRPVRLVSRARAASPFSWIGPGHRTGQDALLRCKVISRSARSLLMRALWCTKINLCYFTILHVLTSTV